MSVPKIIFNNNLDLYGVRYINNSARVPIGEQYSQAYQRRLVLAEIFEQLLLYDRIAIKVDRFNLPLFFLINEIGINNTEELLRSNVIHLVLWTPVIATSSGTEREDKSIDHSTVFGIPPIIAGAYTSEDSDPEKNIDDLLKYFPSMNNDRKRIFKRIAIRKYILPDNSIAGKSAEIVIDAYASNRLKSLELPFEKAPDQLDHIERAKLLQVGNSVLETTFLAQNGFLSNNDYPYYSLTSESIRQIETALHVEANTSTILQIENVAALKKLYLEGIIPFESVYTLRQKRVVKEYRKWIHDVSSNEDAEYITKLYIDEITGKNKFFESNIGIFVRNISMFGLGTGLGTVIAGAAGGVIGGAAEFGLGLFDSYVFEGILQGWNPRMFVDELRIEAKKAEGDE